MPVWDGASLLLNPLNQRSLMLFPPKEEVGNVVKWIPEQRPIPVNERSDVLTVREHITGAEIAVDQTALLGAVRGMLCDEATQGADRRHMGAATGLRPIIPLGISDAGQEIMPAGVRADSSGIESPKPACSSNICGGDRRHRCTVGPTSCDK